MSGRHSLLQFRSGAISTMHQNLVRSRLGRRAAAAGPTAAGDDHTDM
jgi:hypothetical protein